MAETATATSSPAPEAPLQSTQAEGEPFHNGSLFPNPKLDKFRRRYDYTQPPKNGFEARIFPMLKRDDERIEQAKLNANKPPRPIPARRPMMEPPPPPPVTPAVRKAQRDRTIPIRVELEVLRPISAQATNTNAPAAAASTTTLITYMETFHAPQVGIYHTNFHTLQNSLYAHCVAICAIPRGCDAVIELHADFGPGCAVEIVQAENWKRILTQLYAFSGMRRLRDGHLVPYACILAKVRWGS